MRITKQLLKKETAADANAQDRIVRVIYCHSKINVGQSNRLYNLKSFLVVTCGEFRCK